MNGKDIFIEIYKEQVEIFKNSFNTSSRKLFYSPDKKNKLYHAGEFGIYRESIVSKFLKLFTPQRLQIDSGFVIAPMEKPSKQLDIVIYDKNESPLIKSEEGQKFFLIETVASIGEIKSVLTLTQLKVALMDLTKVKVLRETLDDRLNVYTIAPDYLDIEGKVTRKFPFNPKNNPGDQISTFLICEKLDFEINEENVAKIFEKIYDSGIPERHKVDFILSIENGFIGYYKKGEGFSFYPTIDEGYKIDMVMKNNSDDHIKQFVDLIYSRLSLTSIVKPNIGDYLV